MSDNDQQASSGPQSLPDNPHAQEWLRAPSQDQKVKHGYDVRGYNFRDEDKPHLNGYLNHMAEKGATQEEIQATMAWYESNKPRPDLQAEIAESRHLDQLDTNDRIAGEAVLRNEWGHDFHRNLRLVHQYIGNLPASKREAIESAQTAVGTLLLNDPVTLKQLLVNAQRTPELVAQARNNGTSERAEIEKMMRDRRSDYWKGPNAERFQARYRQLLSEG